MLWHSIWVGHCTQIKLKFLFFFITQTRTCSLVTQTWTKRTWLHHCCILVVLYCSTLLYFAVFTKLRQKLWLQPLWCLWSISMHICLWSFDSQNQIICWFFTVNWRPKNLPSPTAILTNSVSLHWLHCYLLFRVFVFIRHHHQHHLIGIPWGLCLTFYICRCNWSVCCRLCI